MRPTAQRGSGLVGLTVVAIPAGLAAAIIPRDAGHHALTRRGSDRMNYAAGVVAGCASLAPRASSGRMAFGRASPNATRSGVRRSASTMSRESVVVTTTIARAAAATGRSHSLFTAATDDASG
jgi:hypothetical protein